MGKLLVWFADVGKEDVALVGGKGAHLGEMTKEGFPVPPGFIITATAYHEFIKENNLATKISHLLGSTNLDDSKSLEKTSQQIKKFIVSGKMSSRLIEEIFDAYIGLSGPLKNMPVVVRSSVTHADVSYPSFAGQQQTYLNVVGEANLLLRIKDAWASLFEPAAILFRHQQHIDHFKIGIAIPVQKMIVSENTGVMFSIDPLTNDKTKVVIQINALTPNRYEVTKSDYSIVSKNNLWSKDMQNKQKITNEQIITLAQLSKKLEHHYYFPQESQWVIEGEHMYVVQTRPITSNQTGHNQKSQVLLKGDPASPGIASGPVKILKSAQEIDTISQGDILIVSQTNPDFIPAMKKAVAIITDLGDHTSHAAIVSREIGIPAVVGTGKATATFQNGEIVTVHGAKGEVQKGGHFQQDSDTALLPYIPTATKVYVNVGQQDEVETIASKNADGAIFLRAESIMTHIGIHPKKMIQDGKSKEYIEMLAQDLEKFCKAFSPRPVVYRASDFKTSEYRHLVGGKEYEPDESNPILGYRGAFGYINDAKDFDLELQALKILRNKIGLKNLWLMLPFVRTVRELLEVKKIISSSGLYRTASFKIWMMVEIPSNVISLEDFIAGGIDGVSISSDDLTMFILGTDKDNNEVATVFDEQNPAVLWAIEHVIRTAHAHKITVSLYGQALSQHPELLKKLIGWGITSVSVSPDVIDSTRAAIAELEKRLID